jgi:hypothetical protein
MTITLYIVAGLTLAGLATLALVAWALRGWRNNRAPERMDWL